MDNGFSDAVATTSLSTSSFAAAMGARRPRSAQAFPSAARKLFSPNSAATTAPAFHGVVASPASPLYSMYRPRLSSRRESIVTADATGASPGWTRRQTVRATDAALVASAPTTLRPRTAATGIARQVVQEEVELQRRVTRDAQRQLLRLQRELSTREKEIRMLQQQLDKLSQTTQTPTSQCASVSSPTARDALAPGDCKPTSNKVSAKSAAGAQILLIPTLREQLANQDAYKKRLRHMLDRLARSLQLTTANEELLRQQSTCATRERTLFAEKLAQDRNQCRALEKQRARILQQRLAFQRDSERLLATYRDEIAARSEVGVQRQLADRRRRNLLQLLESRPSSDTASRSSSAPAADPPVACPAEAVLRRSQGGATQRHILALNAARRSQRRNSAVLAADASGRRESVFELYEAQYERILAETGESDAIRVLEGFLGFADSQKRLKEIEQELGVESERLEQEQHAHATLLGHLRSSGIAEVEKRKKIRDYLEQVMHERQAEKVQAKETFGEHAKLFLYIQQGVLNVADLLHCLEERSAAPTTSPATATPPLGSLSASSTVVVGGTRVPVVTGAVSVSEAAYTLTTLVQHALFTARNQADVAAPIAFSTDQVDQIALLAPDLRIDRLVGSTGVPTKPISVVGAGVHRREVDDWDVRRQSTASAQTDQEEELEQTEVRSVRRAIKEQEEQALREAEALFRTIDARKQRQAALVAHLAANSSDDGRPKRLLASALGFVSTGKPHQLPTATYDMSPAAIQGALAAPESEEAMREKLEAVHAFFREKRKFGQAHCSDSSAGNNATAAATATVKQSGGSESRQPTRPQIDAARALTGEAIRRKILRRKGSMVAKPSDEQHAQQAVDQASATGPPSDPSQAGSVESRQVVHGGGKAARSSPGAKGRDAPKRNGSARSVRDRQAR